MDIVLQPEGVNRKHVAVLEYNMASLGTALICASTWCQHNATGWCFMSGACCSVDLFILLVFYAIPKNVSVVQQPPSLWWEGNCAVLRWIPQPSVGFWQTSRPWWNTSNMGALWSGILEGCTVEILQNLKSLLNLSVWYIWLLVYTSALVLNVFWMTLSTELILDHLARCFRLCVSSSFWCCGYDCAESISRGKTWTGDAWWWHLG